ncbi:twin-arginine translocase subunit TatC [Paenibacillus sepulcri]|uniref:Sec-independent protein translocase protein TatC n=1 Tax=Paenibacillus sepulcri TaxID=359917 RepID=A0ABS7C269_9BACL|nr:twin-arginine translocase subunit TatC [Paenibacillus sepulcri]
MFEEKKMTLIEHLAELRKRIIGVIVVLFLTMIGGLILSPKVLLYLKGVPPASGITWNVFSPWDALRIYMQVAFVISAAVTLPYILYQLWSFMKVGLKKEEQEATLRYIPYSVLCFLIGIGFAYFVVFPMSFSFTSRISDQLDLTQTYGIAQYFGFMLSIVIPMSLAFELPVVIMFLTKIGVLTPKVLNSMRRYAYLGLVILASLISPPELISHLMVFIPLVVLYEISVLLSRVVYRKKTKVPAIDAAVMNG